MFDKRTYLQITMEQIKIDYQFPVEQIRLTIKKFLEDKTSVQSKLTETTDIVTFPKTELDSLTIVELLIELDSIVGHKLPVSLIKVGGYESIEQLQDDLLPKLEEKWQKKALR